MRQRGITALLVCTLLLPACSSSNGDCIRIAQHQLRAHTRQPEPEYTLYRLVMREKGDRLVGELDETAFPNWGGAPSTLVSTGESASIVTSGIGRRVPANGRRFDRPATPRGGFSSERACGTRFSD